MHIVVAGASGMIGTALVQALRERGDQVTTLVRRAPTDPTERQWDPAAGRLDPEVLRGVDAVIGLSGAPVADLPWTQTRRHRIKDSRVSATRTLATAINQARSDGFGPDAFLSASGVNAYGNSRPSERLTEASPVPTSGGGFLCEVVAAWEEAATLARRSGTRVALLRTGIVSGQGGAFDRLELLARLGIAGPVGSGRNVWPWISLRDEIGAMLHVLDYGLAGPVNLVGPAPVTSGEVIRAVARQVHRPYWAPTPRWAVRTVLRDAADDLVFVDLPAVPERLLESGYRFRDQTVAEAIAGDRAR